MKRHLERYFNRPYDSHKGQYGKILFIVGSKYMTGAAALAAYSAFRTGSGQVFVRTEEEAIPIVQSLIPEAIIQPLEGWNYDLSTYNAIGFGPGINENAFSAKNLRVILDNEIPKVIDAGAINLLARDWADFEKYINHSIIFTPHLGELKRLLNIKKNTSKQQQYRLCRKFSKTYGSTLVVKGSNTKVLQNGKLYINPTGNPGMATAGSGDVLTGVITSLLGQGFFAFNAAKFGVYIHGMAGDIMAYKLTEPCLMATDIANGIPKAIQVIRSRLRGVDSDY